MSESNSESLRHQLILLKRIGTDWINDMMQKLYVLDDEPEKTVSAADPELGDAIPEAITKFAAIYGPTGTKFFSIQKDGIADENEWNNIANDPECVAILHEADKIRDEIGNIFMQADEEKKTRGETLDRLKTKIMEEKVRLAEKLAEVEAKIKTGEGLQSEVGRGERK